MQIVTNSSETIGKVGGFSAESRLHLLAQDIYYNEITIDEMADIISEDRDLLLMLLKKTGHDVRDLVRDYLLSYFDKQKHKVAAKAQNGSVQFGQYTHNSGENSGETSKPLPANPAPSHPTESALTAKERVKQNHARRALMQIDGRELRDFTIGECRTVGRRKTREARILTALGERLGHLNHTDTVGAIMSDNQIADIIKETS